MPRIRMNPSKMEIEGLQYLCKEYNCSMEMLINAIMSNCVADEIELQVEFLKEQASGVTQ